MALQDTSIHIDVFLTDVSLAYRNGTYVGDQVYPQVNVDKRSAKWPVYGRENLRRRENRRGKTGFAAEVGMSLSSDAYVAEEHCLRTLVSREDIQLADDPVNPEMDATEFLADQVLLGYEYDVAARATSTAVVTSNSTLAGTTQWSDYTNSTPLTNIRDARITVRQNVLMAPTHILLPYEVALVLADHPSIKDLIKYTDPNALTESGLPPTLRGLRVIEASAIQDAAAEGQTFSAGTVWGKTALIFVRQPSPGLKRPSFGYSFVAPDVESGVRGLSTRRYEEPGRKGLWVESAMTYAIKEVAVGGAYLYAGAIA
jgi:hypothetical protein